MRKIALFVLVLAGIVAVAQTAGESVAAAKQLLRQHDSAGAAKLLERALAIRQNDADLHYLLGSAYMEEGETANVFSRMSFARKIKTEFERAVELNPDHLEARHRLIMVYVMAPALMGGGETKAIEQAAEIKRRNGFQGHRAFAYLYLLQKKLDLARKEYIDAVSEQPASAAAHTALGSFLANQDKNFPAARASIEKAIDLDPSYMPAQFRLGQVAALSGSELTRGEEALRKYLQYEPKDNEPELAAAYYNLGLIYERQHRLDEAWVNFHEASRLNPHNTSFSQALKRL